MKYVENVSTTSEIFQSHRIADMQNFVVATRTVIIAEYRLCMMIVVKILKKRTIKGGKEQKMNNNHTCNCQHNNNSRDNEPCCRCDSRQTNADRIRNMSDEELAEWIHNMCEFEKDEEPYRSIYNLDTEQEEEIHGSYGDLLYWLQSEAE